MAVNYDNAAMPIVSGVPVGIAVNASSVVWTTPIDRSAVESHTLMAVTNATDNKAGYGKLGKSVPALLPTGDCAIDAMYGYWANGAKLDRDLLTAQEGMAQTITSAPAGADHITAFAINATALYASTDDGKLFTHSLTPPTDPNDEKTIVPPVLVARDQKNPSSVLIDGTKLYWMTEDCFIRSTGL
jgi:hypothetical protein